MKTWTATIIFFAQMFSVIGAPVVLPGAPQSFIPSFLSPLLHPVYLLGSPVTDGDPVIGAELTGRDGNTEFDTDICILRREATKRGEVIGMGINNCDL